MSVHIPRLANINKRLETERVYRDKRFEKDSVYPDKRLEQNKGLTATNDWKQLSIKPAMSYRDTRLEINV